MSVVISAFYRTDIPSSYYRRSAPSQKNWTQIIEGSPKARFSTTRKPEVTTSSIEVGEAHQESERNLWLWHRQLHLG